MRSLARLIRASRSKVDEIRRQMADLQANIAMLEEQIRRHDIEVAGECERAPEVPMAMALLPAYRERMAEERQKIVQDLQACLAMMPALQQALYDKFSEVKKMEKYQEIKDKEEILVVQKKEQERLDEIALRHYIRPLS